MLCVALLAIHQGNVLILKRGLTAPWMAGLWNLPGGLVDPGEDADTAVRREADEEAGIAGDPVHFQTINDPEYSLEVYTTVLESPAVQINEEHSEFAWVNEANWRSYDYVPHLGEMLSNWFGAPT